MNTTEHKLSALQPARQTELARRILEIPQRRRQRRRDCVVGVAGLLTGIAATLLVVMGLPGVIDNRISAVQEVPNSFHAQRHEGHKEEAETKTLCPLCLCEKQNESYVKQEVPAPRFHAVYEPDPIDLDALIARYEKLLRHRRDAANRFVVVTPILPATMPDGVSPWEYRKKLLEEYTM